MAETELPRGHGEDHHGVAGGLEKDAIPILALAPSRFGFFPFAQVDEGFDQLLLAVDQDALHRLHHGQLASVVAKENSLRVVGVLALVQEGTIALLGRTKKAMAPLPDDLVRRRTEKLGRGGIDPLDDPSVRIHNRNPSTDAVEHIAPEFGRFAPRAASRAGALQGILALPFSHSVNAMQRPWPTLETPTLATTDRLSLLSERDWPWTSRDITARVEDLPGLSCQRFPREWLLDEIRGLV